MKGTRNKLMMRNTRIDKPKSLYHLFFVDDEHGRVDNTLITQAHQLIDAVGVITLTCAYNRVTLYHYSENLLLQ